MKWFPKAPGLWRGSGGGAPGVFLAVVLLSLLAGCGGRAERAAERVDSFERKAAALRTEIRSLAAAPEAAKRSPGGLVDRARAWFSARDAEAPRDRFVRLKASQNVHIRKGQPLDRWFKAAGTTPEEMRALEDEFWLDPQVRADVLKRTQDALNANRKPMR